jgi:murein DD-endopeptidase MepM/ murein hydrolase activator NlpD
LNQFSRPSLASGISRIRPGVLGRVMVSTIKRRLFQLGRSWPAVAVLLIAVAGAGCSVRMKISVPQIKVSDLDSRDYRLIWPLPISTTARITSPFGRRRDPVSGMQRFHGGIDLDGETGDPIYAAGAGKVVFSGERSGYGLLMIVDHGKGLNSYYGHCSRLLSSRGERVDRGAVIALIGSTGRSTGSHLHFETRKHGQPFDPVQILPRLKKI